MRSAVCSLHRQGKQVCVIGGGDSAMEEATFLTRFCTKVYLLHRRNTFRASKIMTERALANPKIVPVYDVTVEEVLGNGKEVTGVRVRNVNTKEVRDLPLSGVFLAIGHLPNSDLVKGVVQLDEEGYIVTQGKTTYTSAEGIFAWCDFFSFVGALLIHHQRRRCGPRLQTSDHCGRNRLPSCHRRGALARDAGPLMGYQVFTHGK